MNNKDFAAMVARRAPSEEGLIAAIKKFENDKAVQFAIGRILSIVKQSVAPELDTLKRLLFYGKIDESSRTVLDRRYEHAKLHAMHDGSPFKSQLALGKATVSDPFTLNLFHVIAGIGSELGEMTEAFENTCNGDHDEVNWSEELGDTGWYLTYGINTIGTTAEDVQMLIDTKLEKRHKGKVFNAENTINRDVKAERKAMENVKN